MHLNVKRARLWRFSLSCYNHTAKIALCSEEPMAKSKAKTTSQVRLHAVISGIVQGVNFRYYTTRQAQELGLTGWVANRWDGSVEVVAEGARSQLEDLL